jgi:hypothetical protein
MSNKYILLSILIIGSVFSSGCLFENNNNSNNKANQSIGPDFIIKTNLPPGFTFEAIHDINAKIGNSYINGSEGVYKYGGKYIYIQAFKSDDADALFSQYKEDLREDFRKDYNPFEEISINGHAATKFNDFRVENGETQPRYNIIWAKGDYLVQVGSSSDPMIVFSLASATGY